MPRRQRPIDAGQVYELSRIGATIKEMAAVMRIPVQTLEGRIFAKQENEIKAAYERGKSDLKVSIRRILLDQAANGSTSAAIWLSKQLLGYSEKNAERVAAEEAQGEQQEAPAQLVFAPPAAGPEFEAKLAGHLAPTADAASASTAGADSSQASA